MPNKCNTMTYDKPWLKAHDGLFVVRLYDGFDNLWIDVSKELPLEEAMKIWREKTKDGTEKYEYNHIDYFDVFPSDTKMVFSEGSGI